MMIIKGLQSRTSLTTFALLMGLSVSAYANEAKNTAPDNSKRNKEIQAAHQATAESQGTSKPDTAMTAKIRQAIVKDDSLSTYAHNVKIITKDGIVHLKGPVETSVEKEKIEHIAKGAAGDNKVQSSLEVTTTR